MILESFVTWSSLPTVEENGFVVLVFSPGDDLIDYLNKAMAFLTVIVSSRFPSTNNQLRTSSNPRNQATIQDGRVIVQQVQGRQGQNYSGTTYKGNATSSRGNTTIRLARVVKCYNCQDEEQLAFLVDLRIPAGQAQTIIPHNAAFQTEDLDTYDSDCDDLLTAQAILMANISNYGSDIILEATIQDTNLQAQQDSMILAVIEQMSEQMINHVNNWEKANKEQNNETITTELERYKERVKNFEQRLNIDLSSHEKMIDSQMDDMIREKLHIKTVDSLKPKSFLKQIKRKGIPSMQLQQEVFQNDESCVNQNVVEIQEYFKINDLKARLQDKDKTICKLKDIIQSLREITKEENVNHDKCDLEPINKELENSMAKLLTENERLCNEVYHVKQVVQIVLWYSDSECSKHMKRNLSQLMNFVSKFMGTLDSGMTKLQGLWGSQDTNLYIISLDDMLKSSPICLLSKASKTKTWLWHCRLSHLNFAYVLGKSKKSSHQPRAKDTNQEKLYLLHMDLCGLMRMASINRKRTHKVGDPTVWTNDHEDLSKFDAKAYIRIFGGYTPAKKAFRIYNRRTRIISKTIHVTFDELTSTISEQFSLGLKLQYITPATSSTGLVSKPVSQQPCIPPNRNDLDRLFQPMFDEYFNPLIFTVSPVQEAAALRDEVLAYSPVSISINQDAPSTSIPSSQEQEHSPVISQGSSSNVRQIHTLFEHISRWTKDHPIENVISDPSRSVSTRKQLETDVMWCYFDAFLTLVEPKNFKQAMTEPSWIDAMQEEIHEFERLEV
ncbi:integrase, catalytic region, zinc finger, CCHC-type containing protein [Tanacetum coccineum]